MTEQLNSKIDVSLKEQIKQLSRITKIPIRYLLEDAIKMKLIKEGLYNEQNLK